jgi:hypothetical protein
MFREALVDFLDAGDEPPGLAGDAVSRPPLFVSFASA